MLHKIPQITSHSKYFTRLLNLSVVQLKHKALSHVSMRRCHPPDGSTSPKYKLLCFKLENHLFCQIKNALAFNRDTCCHLVLCLRLLPFHWLSLLTKQLLVWHHQNTCITSLGPLSDTTQIGSFMSVLHCPRVPRQVRVA